MRQERARARAIKESKQNQSKQSATLEVENSAAKPSDAFTNRKNFLWVVLAAGMAASVVGSQFLPGVGMHDSLTSVYSSMLWCGIFGAALARYLTKNAWIGFAMGSVIGVTLNVLASVV